MISVPNVYKRWGRTVIAYLFLGTMFTNALTLRLSPIAEFRFSYVVIIGGLIWWILRSRKLYINRTFLVLFLLFVFYSALQVCLGYTPQSLLLKQTIGILLHAVFFYTFIAACGYDLKRLFRIYCSISFVVAVIGLIQEVSFLLGFKPGYDYSPFLPYWRAILNSTNTMIRVNSVFSEPAGLCIVLMPAFFTAVVSLFRKTAINIPRYWCIAIIIAFLLSFSTVGYFGIFIMVILLTVNFKRARYLFVAGAIIGLLFSIFYFSVSDFRKRTDDSVRVLTGSQRAEFANFTTFTFYMHARIAWHSFIANPMFGTGIGSYEVDWERYKDIVINIDLVKIKALSNSKDGNSLLFRWAAETGLFGLITIFLFIWKFYVPKRDDRTGYLWIINNGILCMFLMRLLRHGHYFVDGMFFFFWVYYFSKFQSLSCSDKTVW